MKRKICIVTGTRAEYGLLYWLMKESQEDDKLELKTGIRMFIQKQRSPFHLFYL